ncbi:Ku protein [Brucella pituitosa]|uniref:non-homologous end joining protein Ku n=1 Tax=Brucella pituitosa TaxID=571256 RepID=UPI0009A24C7E|nr:Ku protein [Brucella pituitosa]
MAPRANWKGQIRINELLCPVALYTAASTSERVSFHLINRKTGNRLSREFVDSDTGKPVAREDQVKGYEIAPGTYVSFSEDEIAAAVPDSDKTLNVLCFVGCDAIDDVYLDRPYYLAPVDGDQEGFTLLREAMQLQKVGAIAEAVLFRRARKLLIRPYGQGLLATTLNFDYEVRSSKEAFADIGSFKFDKEMLELAKHIIDTKMGSFDPASFDDRYDTALADLIKAKIAGKPFKKPAEPKSAEVIDLKEALRKSAGIDSGSKKSVSSKAHSKKPARNTRDAKKAS